MIFEIKMSFSIISQCELSKICIFHSIFDFHFPRNMILSGNWNTNHFSKFHLGLCANFSTDNSSHEWSPQALYKAFRQHWWKHYRILSTLWLRTLSSLTPLLSLFAPENTLTSWLRAQQVGALVYFTLTRDLHSMHSWMHSRSFTSLCRHSTVSCSFSYIFLSFVGDLTLLHPGG